MGHALARSKRPKLQVNDSYESKSTLTDLAEMLRDITSDVGDAISLPGGCDTSPEFVADWFVDRGSCYLVAARQHGLGICDSMARTDVFERDVCLNSPSGPIRSRRPQG